MYNPNFYFFVLGGPWGVSTFSKTEKNVVGIFSADGKVAVIFIGFLFICYFLHSVFTPGF